MRTLGFDKQAFLYLNGLSVDSLLRLSENIELLPAKPDCYRELFLGLGKSDEDISVISLFLPMVRSQLRVRGADSKDTAIRSWNAVWDALLLGAVCDCEVICNLQSDVGIEELTPDSTVVVTNYFLRGFSGEPRSISQLDIKWIEQNFAKARALLDDATFQNAVHCLATYRWHSMSAPQLAIIWSGIEALFGIDSELSFRVSLYSARFLEPDDRAKQVEVFSTARDLYKVRSRAVHGTPIKTDARDAVVKSADLLRRLVMRCAEQSAIPNVSTFAP